MSVHFSFGTFSQAADQRFPGLVLGEKVIPLNAVPALTNADSILALLENWEANFAVLQAAVVSLSGVNALPLAQVKVLSPVNLPRQVFCSGANYKKHVIDLIIDEGGGPMTENMTTE